jgi:hypothetical protein
MERTFVAERAAGVPGTHTQTDSSDLRNLKDAHGYLRICRTALRAAEFRWGVPHLCRADVFPLVAASIWKRARNQMETCWSAPHIRDTAPPESGRPVVIPAAGAAAGHHPPERDPSHTLCV